MSSRQEEGTLHKPYKAFLNIFTKTITIYRNVINNLNLHVLASNIMSSYIFVDFHLFIRIKKKKRKIDWIFLQGYYPDMKK